MFRNEATEVTLIHFNTQDINLFQRTSSSWSIFFHIYWSHFPIHHCWKLQILVSTLWLFNQKHTPLLNIKMEIWLWFTALGTSADLSNVKAFTEFFTSWSRTLEALQIFRKPVKIKTPTVTTSTMHNICGEKDHCDKFKGMSSHLRRYIC